ncbi:MAG: hypothetical protein J6Q07_01115 [Alistipes sp.]|nr:hypothetical protein [Alistipes sp.]
MARAISDIFLNDLLNGSLSEIREIILKDDTLMLDLRGKSIMVYYRGGKLLEIKENGKSYQFICGDKQYIAPNFTIPNVEFADDGSCDTSLIEEYIAKFKYNMDIYFGGIRINNKKPKRHSLENEIRQHIVRENNFTKIAKDTDYFILDTECGIGNGKKIDFVAIEWISKTNARKLQNGYRPKLVFFELKYGGESMARNSGLKSHLDDFKLFKENNKMVESFKKDMLEVLEQKRKLGLIPYLNCENKNDIKEFADDIELIFLIANYKKNSEVLMREIEQMEEFQMITASYLGYGLYKNNLVDKSILKDYDPNHP